MRYKGEIEEMGKWGLRVRNETLGFTPTPNDVKIHWIKRRVEAILKVTIARCEILFLKRFHFEKERFYGNAKRTTF
jgi:hypothetical protein